MYTIILSYNTIQNTRKKVRVRLTKNHFHTYIYTEEEEEATNKSKIAAHSITDFHSSFLETLLLPPPITTLFLHRQSEDLSLENT